MTLVILLDLANLRIGKLQKVERIVSMPNLLSFKYIPLSSMWGTKEIANVPESAVLEVLKADVGGVSDADKFVILLKGERGEAPFLDKILSEKYGKMAEELERIKRESAIARGIEKAKSAEYSREVLEKLGDLEKARKTLERLRPKRSLEIERI